VVKQLVWLCVQRLTQLEEAMTRFYFHIRDGIRLVTDDVGKDLKDIGEARREAEMLAAEVRSEITKPVDLVKELHVEIEDETGRTVAVVKLDQGPPLNLI
jgi:hypothetical protein